MEFPDSKIAVLDGAMGTMIQKYAPTSDGNNDLLNLTAPQVIARIHREYIEAGADIIETNTFGANRISQKEYGLSDKAAEIAFAGASIARRAANEAFAADGRKILVAGSIGPTSKSLSLATDASDSSYRQISFDELAEAYEEEIRSLVKGGVDMILFETCFDALNVKAGLYAMCRIFPEKNFPVMVSVSVSDRSGRTLTGQTLEAFYTSVRHYPLEYFGLNCSLGAEGMYPLMQNVSEFAECMTGCYPNAGLPNELGAYDESPEKMAADMKKMAGIHSSIPVQNYRTDKTPAYKQISRKLIHSHIEVGNLNQRILVAIIQRKRIALQHPTETLYRSYPTASVITLLILPKAVAVKIKTAFQWFSPRIGESQIAYPGIAHQAAEHYVFVLFA